MRSLWQSMCAALLVCSLALTAGAENWPQWRGSQGTGVSREKDVPVAWSESRGLAWKCPLPEWGTSTPAIWDDAIFVSSHEGERLLLLKLDRKTGKIEWSREVGRGTAPRTTDKRTTQKFHDLHNLASPSPVTDGNTVVVHFGNGDLAAFDFAGKQLWKRNLAEDYGPYTIWWGHANSPVLHNGLAISVCLQDSLADLQVKPAESYVVAHDLRDGHVKWKTMRLTAAKAEECDAYTTPLLLSGDDTSAVRPRPDLLVVWGGNQLDAYDPTNGRQWWHLPGLVGGRTITGATAGLGHIFCTQGMRGPLLAVDYAEAKGQLDPKAIRWKFSQGTPDSCSPVLWDKLLFTVGDDGIARCFDAEFGALKWKERLKGGYKASPVACAGRIFFLNTEGLCTVISATPYFDRLLENQLDDQTLASPAIAHGRIYIRGRKSLYCLGR